MGKREHSSKAESRHGESHTSREHDRHAGESKHGEDSESHSAGGPVLVGAATPTGSHFESHSDDGFRAILDAYGRFGERDGDGAHEEAGHETDPSLDLIGLPATPELVLV